MKSTLRLDLVPVGGSVSCRVSLPSTVFGILEDPGAAWWQQKVQELLAGARMAGAQGAERCTGLGRGVFSAERHGYLGSASFVLTIGPHGVTGTAAGDTFTCSGQCTLDELAAAARAGLGSSASANRGGLTPEKRSRHQPPQAIVA